MSNKAKIVALQEELKDTGNNLAEVLDTVVVAAAQQRATEVNNEGIEEQLGFILESGWSPSDIIFHVRKEAGERIRMSSVRAEGETVDLAPRKYRIVQRVNEYTFFIEWLNVKPEPKWYILLGTTRDPVPWFDGFATPELALEAWKKHYIPGYETE